MADNSLFSPGFRGIQSLDLLPTNSRIFDLRNLGALFQDGSRAYFPRPSTGGGARGFGAQTPSDLVGPIAFGPLQDKRLMNVQQTIGAPAPAVSPGPGAYSYRSPGTPTTFGGRS